MKRKIIRISLIVCAALLLATGIFLLATAGRTVEKDGLKQNTLRYMENVYFEDGAVHYTIVNRTHKKMLHGQKPYVEKLIDGQWRAFALWSRKQDLACTLPAFSESEEAFGVDCNLDRLAGKYRLLFGYIGNCQDADGNAYLQTSPDAEYVVGYFEITEEQSPTTTPAHVYYENGYKKNDQAVFSAALSNEGEVHLSITLENGGDKPLVAELPKYLFRTYKSNYFERLDVDLRYPEEFTVAPGECVQMDIPVFEDYLAMDPLQAFEKGRYAFGFPCHFEGEERFYAVQIFDFAS